jgi:ATP-dependent Clp protease protease subunit
MSEEQKNITLPLPSHFDRLLESRIIWVGTDVNDTMAADLCAKLLLLSAEDPEKDIYMYINSPGGSVTAGMAIYDIMNLIPNDVSTIATGMAASMGQFLLTSGAKGKRYITPNSRVLLHQPLGGYGGSSTEIKIQAELINDMKYRLAGITAENTGKTLEQVIEDGDRDNWFTAEGALEYGFVDHIVKNVNDVHNIVVKKESK